MLVSKKSRSDRTYGEGKESCYPHLKKGKNEKIILKIDKKAKNIERQK